MAATSLRCSVSVSLTFSRGAGVGGTVAAAAATTGSTLAGTFAPATRAAGCSGGVSVRPIFKSALADKPLRRASASTVMPWLFATLASESPLRTW